jgi:hypothetical protein
MSEEESAAILAKTLHVHLDPDLSSLSDAETAVVRRLVEVGRIFQKMHEHMRHREAIEAHAALVELDRSMGSVDATQNLLTLYYSAKGPVIRGLDGVRKPFLPVAARAPGRNVYPWGVEREEVESYLEKHPAMRPVLLDLRAVVRRSEREQVEADLATLEQHPALEILHPEVRSMLETLLESAAAEHPFYALPYSIAFAEPMMRSYQLLMEAGSIIADEDPEFAGYLRNRARDLLSDDYESGDASWVTGSFKNLNAQIGSYEVYDDLLYGVKSFFGLNVLLRDKERSEELRQAIQGIQAFENSLPYEPEGYGGSGNKKTVREGIPVGVYNIIADFGQSRGANTATILPNESAHARKYGRTILLRTNIMENADLFEIRRDAFAAAVGPEFVSHLSALGGFYRTLWHEIGHYLGVDRTRDGRELGEALEANSSTMEELKADLVSLFLVEQLHESGYYTDEDRLATYASGVRRTLQKNEPQRTQPYQTMQLMQMNFFLKHGLIEYVAAQEKLTIHYDRYHDVAERMLRIVLSIQSEGDARACDKFIDEYTAWKDDLHGVLAESMRSSERYRYSYVTYAILADESTSP